jgi:DNA ligase-3
LEGLVVKDKMSTYDPNARHWNKIKKDYLEGMADSADLIGKKY